MALRQHVVDESGFSRTEKPCDDCDRNLVHIFGVRVRVGGVGVRVVVVAGVFVVIMLAVSVRVATGILQGIPHDFVAVLHCKIPEVYMM
jgi:hypothetical protein